MHYYKKVKVLPNVSQPACLYILLAEVGHTVALNEVEKGVCKPLLAKYNGLAPAMVSPMYASLFLAPALCEDGRAVANLSFCGCA